MVIKLSLLPNNTGRKPCLILQITFRTLTRERMPKERLLWSTLLVIDNDLYEATTFLA